MRQIIVGSKYGFSSLSLEIADTILTYALSDEFELVTIKTKDLKTCCFQNHEKLVKTRKDTCSIFHPLVNGYLNLLKYAIICNNIQYGSHRKLIQALEV